MTTSDEHRWELRMRRAFKVPDPITDSHAYRLVAYELTRVSTILGEVGFVSVGETLAHAFVSLAAEGTIDDAFLDKEHGDALFINPAPDRALSPVQLVIQRAGLDGSQDSTWNMATRLVETVSDHVRQWPVEPSLGKYGHWPDQD